MKEFREAFAALDAWAGRAHELGWLSADDFRGLAAIEQQDSATLFGADERRPLVIGLFGGTGVGKSSLLNRLAGADIATAGVRRPTSTAVTLYLHESVSLQSLPAESPKDRTRVCSHDIGSRRDVVWLDMPDIDSVEVANRELVFAWLPYIDWIVYVVSPERYRDDVGWRVLGQRGRRHHWLFVMNRLDEAGEGQLEGFRTDLVKSGFAEPTLLGTSCVAAVPEDEFDRLEETINAAIDQHGLAELQRIGVLARFQDLARLRDGFARRFGSQDQWREFGERFRRDGRTQLGRLRAHLTAQSRLIANRYPGRVGWWRRPTAVEPVSEQDVRGALGDRQTQHLLEDMASLATINANEHEIAAARITETIANTLGQIGMPDSITEHLWRALESPGSPMQRAVHGFFGVLTYALPLAAAGWVGFNVIGGYQQGLSGDQAFLGLDFAVHSLLLIGLAWFVPFLGLRWSRPSLRATAKRGLGAGIDAALEKLQQALDQSLDSMDQERRELLQSLPRPGPVAEVGAVS